MSSGETLPSTIGMLLTSQSAGVQTFQQKKTNINFSKYQLSIPSDVTLLSNDSAFEEAQNDEKYGLYISLIPCAQISVLIEDCQLFSRVLLYFFPLTMDEKTSSARSCEGQ